MISFEEMFNENDEEYFKISVSENIESKIVEILYYFSDFDEWDNKVSMRKLLIPREHLTELVLKLFYHLSEEEKQLFLK